MFYSKYMFVQKGKLANVWLAANWEKKLTKSHVTKTSVSECAEQLMGKDMAPLALRLSGQLLVGVVRIYNRQVKYLHEDCSDALTKIKLSFKPNAIDMQDSAGGGLDGAGQNIHQILVPPDDVNEIFGMLTGGLEALENDLEDTMEVAMKGPQVRDNRDITMDITVGSDAAGAPPQFEGEENLDQIPDDELGDELDLVGLLDGSLEPERGVGLEQSIPDANNLSLGDDAQRQLNLGDGTNSSIGLNNSIEQHDLLLGDDDDDDDGGGGEIDDGPAPFDESEEVPPQQRPDSVEEAQSVSGEPVSGEPVVEGIGDPHWMKDPPDPEPPRKKQKKNRRGRKRKRKRDSTTELSGDHIRLRIKDTSDITYDVRPAACLTKRPRIYLHANNRQPTKRERAIHHLFNRPLFKHYAPELGDYFEEVMSMKPPSNLTSFGRFDQRDGTSSPPPKESSPSEDLRDDLDDISLHQDLDLASLDDPSLNISAPLVDPSSAFGPNAFDDDYNNTPINSPAPTPLHPGPDPDAELDPSLENLEEEEGLEGIKPMGYVPLEGLDEEDDGSDGIPPFPSGDLAPAGVDDSDEEEKRAAKRKKRGKLSEGQGGWSKRTRKMYEYLAKKPQQLDFHDLTHGKRKATVSGVFYELLVLKSRGYVEIKQTDGDIAIDKTQTFIEGRHHKLTNSIDEAGK